MKIDIKAKLKAYTRGILPTRVSELINDMDYIPDVKDDRLYARTHGAWIQIDDLGKTEIELLDNSGLNLEQLMPPNKCPIYKIGIRKQEILETELPETLAEDTTYYVVDLTPNQFVDGGTAFSNGNNEYVYTNEFSQEIDGGNATTTQFNQTLLPLNSNGIYYTSINEGVNNE